MRGTAEQRDRFPTAVAADIEVWRERFSYLGGRARHGRHRPARDRADAPAAPAL